MALFQQSVLKKYIANIDNTVLQSAWQLYQSHFFNTEIQQNIRDSKEEEYQEGFVRDLFVNVLGYTLNPQPAYNFVLEKKTVTDATKSDGAILLIRDVVGVVELKDTGTTDLDKVSNQAFGYKNKHKNCIYVITSNFEKLRFYINDATDFEEFNLFTLSPERFAVLYLCLQQQNLLSDVPLKIKQQSLVQEENVTKKLYADYSTFKRKLFQNIAEQNPQHDKLLLFKKTQKLLDRFLFIFFAEDRLLLPPNSVREILKQWEQLKELDNYVSLYNRFKKYFGYLNIGHVGKQHEIFAYNGGLFLPDDVLDTIIIDDAILFSGAMDLSKYDYETEVDVNILGHIFEHSLTEIEELQLELEGKPVEKSKTKRKKEGVFYTPRFITKYIVENTVGALCMQKKEELQINEETFAPQKRKANRKALLDKIEVYRQWLLKLTICDPACGSGAFLNAALEYLKAEHTTAAELTARMLDVPLIFSDIDNSILENNLFGVDINEDAIEIAKLSLWLHTAKKGRKLSNLSNNIKCGNSLINDPALAGEKAFNWKEEFRQVFEKGGFDVVIGNPPYGAKFSEEEILFFRKVYKVVTGHAEAYYLFFEEANNILKESGYLGFIIPNAWFNNKYAVEVRRLLLTEMEVSQIINFNKKIIFEDANVEASIYIGLKSNKNSIGCFVGSDVNDVFQYNISDWLKHRNLMISFTDNNIINSLIEKVNSTDTTLEKVLDISNGFKPYQVGYGVNLKGTPLLSEDVEQKIYHSITPINESYKKELKGKGVKRYALKWVENYVKWGNWLMSPKDKKYFESHKILVRQIVSDYLFATIDTNKFYADQTLYVCINYPNDLSNNLYYYLAILNSKLYGFYFRKFYSQEDDLFPKVKVNELKSLPVKKLPIEQQKSFADQADIMLQKNKELNELSQSFTHFLQTKFPAININNKLQQWHSITGTDFFKELSNQKLKHTLSEQQEWLQYFDEEKAKANNINQIIKQTDAEIDAMVYQLYGLTEEEIKIVEGE